MKKFTKKYWKIFLVVPIILIVGAAAYSATFLQDQRLEDMEKKQVSLKTEDGWTLSGSLYPASGKPVILLPMLSTTKQIWNDFAEELQENGFLVLSIDMRGHGINTNIEGKRISWKQFSDDQFNAMTKDVKAAKDLLKANGADTSRMIVVGASIGANVAMKYAADDSDVKGVVMLSPGLDYRGVVIEDDVKNYDGPVFISASSEDDYSFKSSETLSNSSNVSFKAYENAGHGTYMLSKTEDLGKTIIEWIKEI